MLYEVITRDEILTPLQRGKYWMVLLSAVGLVIIATGAVLFTNNLVDRIKETDRENAANSDMLLQANKMIALSKMAAGIAHEVNNPLASIAEKAGWMKDLLAEEDLAASANFARITSYNVCYTKLLRMWAGPGLTRPFVLVLNISCTGAWSPMCREESRGK